MIRLFSALLILIALTANVTAQQSTSFNYQGRLSGIGTPANGTFDFVFELFGQASGGPLIASVPRAGVPVSGGIFSVQLDFGAVAFDGNDRYLEISVKLSTDSTYTLLEPRQKLASVPYSTRAINAENAQNTTNLGGLPANAFLQKTGDGSQLTNLSGSQLTDRSVSAVQLSADALPTDYSLKLLASRRWDLLKYQRAFPVGSGPSAIEFDGTFLWVANQSDNTLSKVRPSDGTVVQTINVGRQVTALAFDGQNMWVTNSGPNSVTKVRVSDGAILAILETGAETGTPFGIAFDGEAVWITDILNNFVIKKAVSTGNTIGFIAVGQFPTGVAFDGANVWVTNNNSGNVTKIRTSDNVIVGTYPVNVSGAGAKGVVFDGTNIWVASSGNRVTKLRASDGTNLGIFTIPGFSFSQSVGFDGKNIWVSDSAGNSLARIKPTDGTVVGIIPVGANPQGIAFDGTHIWSGTTTGSAITRLAPSFSEP